MLPLAVMAPLVVATWFSYDVMAVVVPFLFQGTPELPRRGKHLDGFGPTDRAYIIINRLSSVLFVLHYAHHITHTPAVPTEAGSLSLLNTLVALPALFLAFDLLYWAWHRALHLGLAYPWVHKHHHRQVVPTRGIFDAINVHPVEFIVGEWLHLLAVMLVRPRAHAATAALFLVLMGVLTAANHTRLDVRLLQGAFSVRAHDLHHRVPNCNYGQYTMAWDRALGTYRGDDKGLAE